MKFTIVFPSHEAEDLSIAAVFTPCLVWKEGKRELLNPHPQEPNYLKGDLKNLLAKTEIGKRLSDSTQKVTVIAHSTGHATWQDLEHLVTDLEGSGFTVTVVHH
jgi:hypothetical protein